ncbi:hypothetical protein B0182_05945 [Moraxella bovis]|nr:hypothetical protein B0182_05945 [Moraxella bovis]
MESLLKIDAISRQDYDDAQSAVEVARANVDVARAGVQNAKNDVATAQANIQSQRASINKAQNDLSTATEDLSYTTIVAPMDGTVVSVTQKEGTTVNAMQSAPTIVRLADLSRIRINAQISEADVVNVSAGMPARFNIIGNTQQQFDTTLAGVEPTPGSKNALFGVINRLKEAFKMSIYAMKAHKMRTLLTMLGIIIGIASVVSIAGLGQGSQAKILADINALGANTITVMNGYPFGDARRRFGRDNLTVADAQAVADQPYALSASPMVNKT